MRTIQKHSISNILPFGEAWRGITIREAWRGFAFLFLSLFLLASCSESDDTVNEWENWQQKNDTYWSTLYTETQQRIANGDTSWKIIPSWTYTNQHPVTDGTPISLDPTDNIIVHVEKSSGNAESPMFTDSVSIHYLGRMIPSPTYTSGYIFDSSYDYTQGYNLQIMRPTTGLCGGFIEGFTTALLNMHKGDRWTVYIPYQLAYGSTTPGSSSSSGNGVTTSTTSSSNNGIQPYSDLIFDLTLVNFYKPGETVPKVMSKANNLGQEE